MIACVDTRYTKNDSRTAVLLFKSWADEGALNENVIEQQQAAVDYIPGQFFLRELPCILDAIKPFREAIKTIIVDGYVHLGVERAGLGQKLFEALEEHIAVIGVAKNEYRGANNARQVFRGSSTRPLFVTAAGMELVEAAQSIERMHGPFRIPTLLKQVDQRARWNE